MGASVVEAFMSYTFNLYIRHKRVHLKNHMMV